MDSAVTADPSLTKRQLIVRDSFAFLTLALITIALFAITLFLFKSFTGHRAVLAQRWLDRAKRALDHGHPQEAVDALQVTLDYAPDNRAATFLLADALAAAGHLEEANSYLSELWQTEPGSGVINLQLARIAATRRERQEAIDFYRAALYGTWEGDGVERRRAVRLELAQYLIAQDETEAARAELLVAGGNVSDDPSAEMVIGHLLERTDDLSGARRLYLRAAGSKPYRARALASAGKLSFRARDFSTARDELREALQASDNSNPSFSADERAETTAQLRLLDEVLVLTPAADLPKEERVQRIVQSREIARTRLGICRNNLTAPAAELVAVAARLDAIPGRKTLLHSIEEQNSAIAATMAAVRATLTFCPAAAPPPGVEDQALALLASAARKAGH